jgi:cytochrome P450
MSATANRLYPPGPRGHFLLGNLPEFGRDLLGFFVECAGRYGDIVRVRLAGSTAYLLNHPDLMEEVLVGQNRNFIKHTFFWRHVRAIFGDGLLTSEGDFWRRQRRLAQPAFHRERIASYGKVMVDYSQGMLGQWRNGDIRDVHQDMMELTMKIVVKTLFNSEMADEVEEVGSAFEVVIQEIAKRFRRPFRIPDGIPTPGNLRYRRSVQRLDRLVYRIIEERSRSGRDAGDLLSLLLAARDEDGSRMNEKQIRDEVVTLFLAGHETTALTLSWTFYLLSQNPAVDARLAAELAQALGERSPTVDELPRLRFAEMVVMESMRLYPPAYVVGREALADCTLGGYRVPAGTTVFMSPYLMHRDPRYFEDPQSFLPGRWEGDRVKRLPRFAYFPFGGGPRVCIGNQFAMMEAVLLLATIARKFRLRLVPGHPITPFPSITLRPHHGVRVELEERKASSS